MINRSLKYGAMRPSFDTNSHRKERGGEGDLRYGYGLRDCGSFERLAALIDKPARTKNHYPIPRRNNLFVSCVHATVIPPLYPPRLIFRLSDAKDQRA